MNKVDRKKLISSLDLAFEKSEWTNLDEKLSFLEELSNEEIVNECKIKFRMLKEIPASLKDLYVYTGDLVKSQKKKIDAEDRYIMSIFLAYGGPKDLDKKN
jgi:hypothetical protein